MPLDPQARPIVEASEKLFPRIGTDVTDASEARRLFAAMPRAIIAGPPVEAVFDRTIPAAIAGHEIATRSYRPVAGTEKLPLVIYFHGGGWVFCDLDTHDALCRSMANGLGAVVVSVDYRHAPEAKFPEPLEDAYAVTKWAFEHLDELSADAMRVGIAGDSAGGNLAASVAMLSRDRGGPDIRAQLLMYPVLDSRRSTPSYQENAIGYGLTAVHMKWYWDQYLQSDDDGAHPYASPLLATDLGSLPPACIVTAECDPLRDEGEAYAARLREAGVQVSLRRYDGMIHGFLTMDAVLDVARRAQKETFETFRLLLEGQDVARERPGHEMQHPEVAGPNRARRSSSERVHG